MTHKRLGFRVSTMYRLKRPKVYHYAKQRLSFLIAAMSLFAFVVGNMVGQHGWYAFWKSVMGKEELPVFAGTVTPIEAVPSLAWTQLYGGDVSKHSYAQVPRDLLVPLPAYNSAAMRDRTTVDPFVARIYCTGHLGDYKTGNEMAGSHVGVDICGVPRGTPVRAIGSGIVERSLKQEYGFGHHVMIRHRVPDAKKPGEFASIYVTYAHMDEVNVVAGEAVQKGQTIGTVGSTGFAASNHLHIQAETADAPFHPFWNYTSTEATEAGLSFVEAIDSAFMQERGVAYTFNPILLAQQYLNYAPPATIAGADSELLAIADGQELKPLTRRERMQRTTDERRRVRLARRQLLAASQTAEASVVQTTAGEGSISSATAVAEVTSRIETAQAEPETPLVVTDESNTDVDRISFDHPGSFTRSWQIVTISLKNRYGDTVKSPVFPGKITLHTAYGSADIVPSELTASDFFRTGEATVRVLPHGQRTVVLEAKVAFSALSEPMVYQR